MIIVRYITKEIGLTFISITGILLLIALSNRFAMFLTKAATGELPLGFVFNVVWLYIPELLTFLIPLSLFLAILFAYGRLHAESEMAVLSACGISWSFISKLTLSIALVITLLVGWLSLWVVPTLSTHREKALSEGEALAVINSMLPGRFQMFGEGNLVFYLEDIETKKNVLKGVFIAEQPLESLNKPSTLSTPSTSSNKSSSQTSHGSAHYTNQGWSLITAKSAHVEREEKTKNFYLVLNDGYRYKGTPGNGEYTLIKFDEYGRAVQQEAEPISNDLLRLKSSNTLLNSGSASEVAEFQWRLSIPLSVPILALLAIPLARVRPRHGRFANFLPAIVLYIIYYNLFTLAKRWVAAGVVSTYLGVWWVHLIFLGIALILLGKESGWIAVQSKKSSKIRVLSPKGGNL